MKDRHKTDILSNNDPNLGLRVYLALEVLPLPPRVTVSSILHATGYFLPHFDVVTLKVEGHMDLSDSRL